MSTDLEQTGRDAIQQGSSSFAAAAALFGKETRADAEMLYAWCRYCDDVIDGQAMGHGASPVDPAALQATLDDLYAKTRAALAGETMSDPVFAAFQKVALRRGIPETFAIQLIDGFAMDVSGRRYEAIEDTLDYCWHVAGVVGAMMALVMGVKPGDLATLRRAQDLGLAFQLTNICRDIVEDAGVGRIYLPGAWLREAGVPEAEIADPKHRPGILAVARRLLAVSEPYYASAISGLPALGFRSAWAVAAARGVYRAIGFEVLKRGEHAWDERVSTSTATKAWLALGGGVKALVSRFGVAGERADLWSKI